MWGLSDFDRSFDRPFDVLDELRRRMDRVFIDFDRGGVAPVNGDGPRANVVDTGADIVVEAEVPGVLDKDLKLTITQDTFTLEGERRADVPEGASVHRRERAPWKFARSFALPTKIDSERATADLRNGVLTVTLPKAAEVRPKHITVKVG